MPDDEIPRTVVPIDHLRQFCIDVFSRFGVPPADAEQAADVLAVSDLRGIDSHGIARLRAYVEMFESGRINPVPRLTVVRDRGSVATVDGDNGLGLVIGPKANAIAMDKADAHGSGWVAVRNTNHFGIAGYYPLKALERDLIGWAMTNATNLVTPIWGAERMLGTNPIAIAFPGLEEPAIVIDMATSAVAFGKIEIALRKGKPVPKGWVVDRDGRDTTNPQDMLDDGAMLPLGSERDLGGHKGYALASMVDILCGPLAGAAWGPFTPAFAVRRDDAMRHVGKGLGHFFGALQIDGFIDATEFKRQIDDWIRVFRATKPAPGTNGPLIPGDPERIAEATRRTAGIPLLPAVVEDLRDVSRRTGVAFDPA